MSVVFRPLADLCEKGIPSVNPKRDPEQEFWYVDISSVDNVAKRIVSPQKVTGEQASVRARQLIRKSDILVSTTRPNLNAVALVPDEYDGQVCSTGFCVLRCGPELTAEYLFSFVQSKAFVEPLTNLVKGALYPAVTDKQVLAQQISWVPVEEQRRIAAILKSQLAAVEEMRMAAQEQAKEAEALRLAIYREAFADILPVGIPPEFEDAPDGWRWAKLTDLARLESGHTPSRSRPDWWGGDISWISLTEIRAFDGNWTEETQIKTNKNGIANSAARVLPRGTVCFSRTASVGFVTIMAQPMATSQDFANWVCGEDLDPEFLMYALICTRKELRALATGATHKTIYMPTLKEFYLCLPNRPMQERIVNRLKAQLETVSQIRQGIMARLNEIELLPARLLARVFSGGAPSNPLESRIDIGSTGISPSLEKLLPA